MTDSNGYDASRAWSTLTVVIFGTLMSMINNTVVSVALPTMMNVFGVSMGGIQWITTAYTLVMAIVIPLTPYLSRVFSSERIYLTAMFIFIAGSFLCGFAWNLNSMIVFRVIQAIGGGMMTPIGMGMVVSLFPPDKRGAAFGVFGVAAMAAPAFGPTLGGYLVQYFGWRYIFYINIPVGIISIILAFRFFKFPKRLPFPSFDILGFISASVASGLILYLLGKNQDIDWNKPIYIYATILGIGSLIFFIVNELFHDSPLLDLRIFKDRNYTVSILLTVVQMVMMMSVGYTTPIFLQSFKGMSAMQSGEVLLPSSLVMALIMPVVGRITDVAGYRASKWIIAVGVIISGVSTLVLASLMNVNASVADIIIVSSIRNVGLGICMMPARTLGLINITPQESQKATAMQTFVQQFSGSLTVAAVTVIITSRFNSNYAHAAEQLTPFNGPFSEAVKNLTSSLIHRGLSATDAASTALSTIIRGIYVENYVLAIEYTIFISAIMGILAVFIVPLFKVEDKKSAV